MILNFINWNVNPEIFSIPEDIWLVGGLTVRWYGLLFAASFFVGYYIMAKIFKKEGVGEKVLEKLTIYMALGTILGARIGHCLFYQPDYYLDHPLEILMVWKGGLASHGAAIGILLAVYIFSKKEKKTFLWVMDRIVVIVALSGLFIRTGNLMNSEIVGTVTDKPWGFIFTREIHYLGNAPRHPSQAYEALSYFIIFLVLYFLYFKKGSGEKPGFLFGIFLISIFTMRFIIEFIKDIQVDFESDMVLNMGQILSIPFILLGVFLLFRALKKSEN